MPKFTIEATYMLPVYRYSTYEAATFDEACQMALADDEWEDSEEGHDGSGETFISGAWDGDVEPYSVDGLPIPPQYDETVQRKAELFDEMLAALRKTSELFMLFTDHAVFDHAAAEVHPDTINGTCDAVAETIAKATIAIGGIPVVDGDEGADIYGYAVNEADAMSVARRHFVDTVARVERYGPINLRDGTTLPEAFVAITAA